ncbi:MAG: hypothetical protein ACAF41_33445 (plasmid) [Leptolyngbya sp. BL-A-14]
MPLLFKGDRPGSVTGDDLQTVSQTAVVRVRQLVLGQQQHGKTGEWMEWHRLPMVMVAI